MARNLPINLLSHLKTENIIKTKNPLEIRDKLSFMDRDMRLKRNYDS